MNYWLNYVFAFYEYVIRIIFWSFNPSLHPVLAFGGVVDPIWMTVTGRQIKWRGHVGPICATWSLIPTRMIWVKRFDFLPAFSTRSIRNKTFSFLFNQMRDISLVNQRQKFSLKWSICFPNFFKWSDKFHRKANP